MFGYIVSAALKYRFAVIAAALIVLAWGAYAFSGLTIEAFPDPTDTQVNIITLNPGQPAEEMERQVSIPIERAVNGIQGLARTRSINLFGLSYVTLTFRDGIDAIFARQQTTERLGTCELPDGVKPELDANSTPIGEIYRYTLKSEDHDPLRLRTVNDWTVVPRLMRVDGVADVVSYGGLVREIEIRPDPIAMAGRGITMSDLADTLSKSSINASGGVVERGAEVLVIRSEGIFKDVNDIGRVAVSSKGGTPTLLRDVASVQDGWTPRQGVVSRGHDYDAVEGIILMRRAENPSVVLANVRDKIAELNSKILPPGTSVEPFYDRTELVNTTLETVGHNLLEGAILVTLVLFVFLLDLRAALIVGAIIPLSMLSAFIYLSMRGMAANLISMGAVDFGIIVDGAVVIIEAVAHRMQHNDSPEEVALGVKARVERAVRDVASPTVFSLLIIIAAYLPIFMLQRVEGRIFGPMAHTVVSALIGSLVFSITLVPVLATFAYRKPRKARASPVLKAAAYVYAPSLRWALRWPAPILVTSMIALGFAGYSLATRGSEFLPELNEGGLYLTFTLGSNASLTDGRKMVPVITKIVDEFPEVEQMTSQLGRPEDGTDPNLPNNLEFFLKLRPESEWPKDVSSIYALMDKMDAALEVMPGIDVNFSQPIRDNVNENIQGQFGQIALKIYAEDLGDLQQTADAAKNAIADVPGVADLGIVKSGDAPQIQVRPKREALGRFGPQHGRRADVRLHRARRTHRGPALGRREELRRRRSLARDLARDARRNLEPACPDAERGARPARRGRDGRRRLRAQDDQPRERAALHRRPHERAKSRHGIVRRRREESRRTKGPAQGGCHDGLGRRVRIEGASDEAARARRPRRAGGDADPPLQCVSVAEARGPRAPQRAVCARGWRRGALRVRHAGFDRCGRRVHRARRASVLERRARPQRDRDAQNGRAVARRRDRARRDGSASRGFDDRSTRRARVDSGSVLESDGGRDAATHCGRDRRRDAERSAPDTHRASGHVPPDGSCGSVVGLPPRGPGGRPALTAPRKPRFGFT